MIALVLHFCLTNFHFYSLSSYSRRNICNYIYTDVNSINPYKLRVIEMQILCRKDENKDLKNLHFQKKYF